MQRSKSQVFLGWCRSSAAVVTSACGLVVAHAGPSAAQEREVIYTYRHVIEADGTSTEEVAGSNVVTLSDGSSFTVGPERLTDPDGNQYYFVGDSYQESEGDAVVHEIRLVRTDPVMLSEEELVDAYLEVNPDASEADLDAFRARRARNREVPEPTFEMERGVTDWRSGASAEDLVEVIVVLRDQPPLSLPKADNALLESDPAAWLDRMEARVETIEYRKTDLRALQDPVIADMEVTGGTWLESYWILNAFKAEVDAAALDGLAADTRVQRIELVPTLQPADNYGEEVHAAHQIQQLLDAGIDGETPSGRSTVGDIYVGIIDVGFLPTHVAWNDTSSGSSRVVSSWCYSGGSWTSNAATCAAAHSSWTTESAHGMRVAGGLIADLTDGQDSNYPGTNTSAQKARTGATTESSLSFIEIEDAEFHNSIEKAIELNVDVVNMSIVCSGCDYCATDNSSNVDVDNAMHDGIFFAMAAGNIAPTPSVPCTVQQPAAASGAFTASALDNSAADLTTASIWSSSSRGGDAIGRPIIDLAATGGRNGSTATFPSYDATNGTNNYYISANNNGTSHASPNIAGTAADVKDHLIDQFGTSDANVVGLLYAHMLLMGDGQLEDGNFQVASTPNDPAFGAGRLQARMFNNAGMDAPWRRRWFYGTLDDAEVYAIPLNPDEFDVNQSIPSDVEWFKAALWYHEPNLGANEEPAEIRLNVCRSQGCYACSSLGPQDQRLWLGPVVAGDTWDAKVTGVNVTASTDPNDPHYSEAKREVFLTFYWEDEDWDDADGPSTPMH